MAVCLPGSRVSVRQCLITKINQALAENRYVETLLCHLAATLVSNYENPSCYMRLKIQ